MKTSLWEASRPSAVTLTLVTAVSGWWIRVHIWALQVPDMAWLRQSSHNGLKARTSYCNARPTKTSQAAEPWEAANQNLKVKILNHLYAFTHDRQTHKQLNPWKEVQERDSGRRKDTCLQRETTSYLDELPIKM